MEKVFQHIVVEERDAACIIRINRPEMKNKIGRLAVTEMTQVLSYVDEAAHLKSTIITGTGEYFCGGGQVDGFPDGGYMEQRAYADATVDFQRAIYKARKPVIAAVQGKAFAGGLTVVQGCDLAVASESATFALPELHESYIFPAIAVGVNGKYLPQKKLMEIILLGKVLSAQEALQYDIINKIVPPDKVMDEALKMAAVIAELNTTSITIGKQSYYEIVNMNLEQAMEYSKLFLSLQLVTEDGKEAGIAKLEGRSPVFIGK